MENIRQYIIDNANRVGGPDMQPCLKQSVYAMLVTTDMERYFGANWMSNNGMTVCPRVTEGCPTGEGYHLCKEVCNQEFHAECSALSEAFNHGANPMGGIMVVVGHTYCCSGCMTVMRNAGVKLAYIYDTGEAVRI